MDRPAWVPAPAWAQLGPVLANYPLHAVDVLDDLEAASRDFAPELRCLLLDRFTRAALRGLPLPAAVIVALAEFPPHASGPEAR